MPYLLCTSDPHNCHHRRGYPREPDSRPHQEGNRAGCGHHWTCHCGWGQAWLLQDWQHRWHDGQHPPLQTLPSWQVSVEVLLRWGKLQYTAICCHIEGSFLIQACFFNWAQYSATSLEINFTKYIRSSYKYVCHGVCTVAVTHYSCRIL